MKWCFANRLVICHLPSCKFLRHRHLLSLQDIPTDLKKFDVLVKVLACGVSISNEEYKPVVDEGKSSTEYKTLGTDISGIVQSIGSEVNTLHVGDRVAGIYFIFRFIFKTNVYLNYKNTLV